MSNLDYLYKTKDFDSKHTTCEKSCLLSTGVLVVRTRAAAYPVLIFVFLRAQVPNHLDMCPWCGWIPCCSFCLWQWHFINSPYCKLFKVKTHDFTISITPTNNWQQKIWYWPLIRRTCQVSAMASEKNFYFSFSMAVHYKHLELEFLNHSDDLDKGSRIEHFSKEKQKYSKHQDLWHWADQYGWHAIVFCWVILHAVFRAIVLPGGHNQLNSLCIPC